MADSVVANTTTQQDSNARPNRGNHRGRGRGRHRRGGAVAAGGGQLPTHTSIVAGGGGRSFGGQLTRQTFDAQATPFVPASVLPTAAQSPKHNSSPRKHAQHSTTTQPASSGSSQQLTRRTSRSQAADLATRIHEDISNSIYECAICTSEISRNSKVWSCRLCWTVFHIGCIKKWSKNEGSAVQQQRNTQDGTSTPPVQQWRCPGCNLPKDELPAAYNCWCEKELDPKTMRGLPPHSCGQTCGRLREFPKVCPHPCDQICHAGPCPPCSAMGPKQSCFCGKTDSTRRCIDTEYEAGWSCGAICGDIMPCGDHSCPRPCHEGLCGACEILIDAKCYCGKVEQKMMCCAQEEEKRSFDWNGVFDCRSTCDRPFDCGTHRCEKTCHPQAGENPHCSKSPDVVSHCPCGKSPLAELQSGQRQVCTDPIPNCNEACGKILRCGHPCTRQCHTGSCPPCTAKVPLTCQCGRNKFETSCFGGSTSQPQCFRTCKATLNCGRHNCGERCCTGERKAAERTATKRKLKPLGIAHMIDEGFEAEHICSRTCGRQLKCGNHTCQELCHKGPCGSCREAIFEDISCNCGRTTLQAPLPCGTRPPPCNLPCYRPKSCGHPQVAHNCHTDEEQCPNCPFLTEKACLCGKKTLKNQPCWRSDVLCGLVCGKLLKCGSHTCQKTCHKPGECEDAQVHCQQECRKPKKSCGHPCEQPCHAPSACKEDKACPFRVLITCDCQRKKEEVRCNARVNLTHPSDREHSLKCDDECARLERNRKLAMALHIPDDHTDNHVPYSNETLELYLEDVAWAHKQQDVLRVFAADTNEKRYRFPPMKSRQRAFIHSVAEDFGFDSESVDPEPHRHIVVFKTPKFQSAPMKTLAQAARIKRSQLNVQQPVGESVTNVKRADEASKHDFNGILLRNPRFALTEEELRPVLLSAAPSTDFAVHFLTNSDAVALIPKSPLSPTQISSLLTPLFTSVVSISKLATSAILASFDLTSNDLTVLHTSDTPISAIPGGVVAGGWSQVASRRATPMQAPSIQPVGQKSSFTVLGSKLAEAKRKKKEEEELLRRRRKQIERDDVVDDWSAEVSDEEVEAGRDEAVERTQEEVTDEKPDEAQAEA